MTQDLGPNAKPRKARSAALFVRQSRPSSIKRAEAFPTPKHLVDQLGDWGRARQAATLLA